MDTLLIGIIIVLVFLIIGLWQFIYSQAKEFDETQEMVDVYVKYLEKRLGDIE